MHYIAIRVYWLLYAAEHEHVFGAIRVDPQTVAEQVTRKHVIEMELCH